VDLALRATATVIPTNPTHKHQWYINRETYKERNLVERTWCRLKDFAELQPAMTSSPAILLLQWLWQPSLFGGPIESGA
jgi:transposase